MFQGSNAATDSGLQLPARYGQNEHVIVLDRKNYLFAGADCGAEHAAAMYSLIGTAKLEGIDPESYLRCVLTPIADHPVNRVDELLPGNLARQFHQQQIAA